MTKTEALRRSRSIRAHLQRFQDLQGQHIKDYVRERGRDPDTVALNRLLAARTELNALIELVTLDMPASRELYDQARSLRGKEEKHD